METMCSADIKKRLVIELDEIRYIHSVSTAYTAQCLAMRYDCDLKKAKLAGILHDCAKCMPNDKKLILAENIGLTISSVERKKPDLLHAKLGEYLAKEVYGVNDIEVLNAIRYHTTGRPNMTMLEKIIYLADYIEPERRFHEEITGTRQLAFVDIDRAIEKCTREILEYLKECKIEIDESSKETYSYYYNIINRIKN
jgi:predicted HD superfamily hydrolase involved in NAD metabolism